MRFVKEELFSRELKGLSIFPRKCFLASFSDVAEISYQIYDNVV